ncbi:MAG: hypothetical protein Tsb005_10670 [Gammaproteobacteria bacterium]
MFKFLKKDKGQQPTSENVEQQPADAQSQLASAASSDYESEEVSNTPEPTSTKLGLLGKLRQGLHRTRTQLSAGLAKVILGKKVIDDEILELLETQLLSADVGITATTQILEQLTQQMRRNKLADSQALLDALQQLLCAQLLPKQQPLVIAEASKPYVILMVGVNGAGKTTTIGKLAKQLQAQGKKVLLAAGDTFRAAAIEQLQAWGERNNIGIIAQHSGADSASVIFDAVQAAQARGIDVVIADTAGRLHTQDNLMNELRKVQRVIKKLDSTAPHEVMLVLDAGIGQNALQQVKHFQQAVDVTGITLTKLDGTAKGGVIFAIASEYDIPIRFIGVGEGIDDLRPFDAKVFVEALFDSLDEMSIET